MNRFKVVVILTTIIFISGPANALAKDFQEDEIFSSIFLGQVYEPFDVYLLGVNKGPAVSWPMKLIIRSTELKLATPDRSIGFVEAINGPKKEPWDQEGEVSLDSPEPIPTRLKLSGFFETVLDDSIEDENIGHYVSEDRIAASYLVVAFYPDLKLGRLNFSNAGKKRPLTKAEVTEVKESRVRYEEETKNSECTTVAGFIDDAEQLWTAKIEKTDLTIRVSQYSQPGCAGHMSYIFLLDLLKGGELIATKEIRHYYGAI